MAIVKTRRPITTTAIEFRSFKGGTNPEAYYLLVKGRARGADFYNVFVATELKGACLDILGKADTTENRRVNSNELAEEVWRKESV